MRSSIFDTNRIFDKILGRTIINYQSTVIPKCPLYSEFGYL